MMKPITVRSQGFARYLFAAVCLAAAGTGCPAVFQLSVSKAGSGTGTIASSPAGINCGATCAASFSSGTVVILSAAPLVGSTFTGWSGGGCSGTGTCQVTVNAALNITATFALQTFALSVSDAGQGTGTVSSSPAGINCGSTCVANFNSGTVVMLSAAPSPGSIFAGWSDASCSSSGTCAVTMNAAQGETAQFDIHTFQTTFGGPNNDVALSVRQTSDDGYILTGWTNSLGAGGYDCYLAKLDPDGMLVWQKTFGGSGDEICHSALETTDGGYIIVGYTSSFGAGSDDVYLVKTDSGGSLLWQKSFGGAGFDGGYAVHQTTDGGYIIAGVSTSFSVDLTDAYLVKTDSTGNLVWQKTFGGPLSDGAYAVSVLQTTGGDYVFSGYTGSSSPGIMDAYLVMTDANGNLVWQQTWGAPPGAAAYSVEQTSDGGYIVGGTSGAVSTSPYLAKTDAEGEVVWQKTYGGSGNSLGYSAAQTMDGGYILAGYTQSGVLPGGAIDLVKTDSDGNLTWQKTYASTANNYEVYSVRQTFDGGYVLAGNSVSRTTAGFDIYLGKTDTNGNAPAPP